MFPFNANKQHEAKLAAVLLAVFPLLDVEFTVFDVAIAVEFAGTAVEL
jgi:hypothetical protein